MSTFGSIAVENLSYQELRKKCVEVGTSAKGKKEDLQERLRGKLAEMTLNEQRDMSKAQVQRQSNLAKNLVCPITNALPIDPVTAEDGMVYERSAIVKHIQQSSSNVSDITSPVTKKNMGSRLLQVVPIKELIEKAVDAGEITGDLANQWTEKRSQQQRLEKWKTEAQAGGGEAAFQVGRCYEYASYGVEKNSREAMKWYKLAADAGHAGGMAKFGFYLVDRNEDIESATLGSALLAEASANGVALASLKLGFLYEEGRYPLPTDKNHAIRLLRKGLDLNGKQLGGLHPAEWFLKKSKELLQKLEHDNSTSSQLKIATKLFQ